MISTKIKIVIFLSIFISASIGIVLFFMFIKELEMFTAIIILLVVYGMCMPVVYWILFYKCVSIYIPIPSSQP
jgi:hypothetical protein